MLISMKPLKIYNTVLYLGTKTLLFMFYFKILFIL